MGLRLLAQSSRVVEPHPLIRENNSTPLGLVSLALLTQGSRQSAATLGW